MDTCSIHDDFSCWRLTPTSIEAPRAGAEPGGASAEPPQSYSLDLLHPLHRLELLDERLEAGVVGHHHDEVATEETVVRVDVDAAQHQLLVLGDDGREVVDDAEVVVANDAQGDAILRRALAAPLGAHDAVAEAAAHLGALGQSQR